jgi:hypothetical protein
MKGKNRGYQRGTAVITKISIRGFTKEICPREGKGSKPWKIIQRQLKDARDQLYQQALDLFEQSKHHHEQKRMELEPASPMPNHLIEIPEFRAPMEESSLFDQIQEPDHHWFRDDLDINIP